MFNKSLICCSEITNVQNLYSAIQKELSEISDHHWLQDEVHFIHGHKNSLEIEQAKKIEPPEFFDTFEKQVTGILIATSSLINEGLDLPSIDSVYITYQTKSISHLLQTAGRALRYSEGKQSATIIQVKANDLSYFFNSAWLYQDISDRLRPQIEIIEYSNKEELIEQVLSFVNKKYVKLDELNILKQDLNNLSIGQNARLILFGIKFFGGLKNLRKKHNGDHYLSMKKMIIHSLIASMK